MRHVIARRRDELVKACSSNQRTDPVETISAEIIPLCDALGFLGRQGASILQTRSVGMSGRPMWLFGIHSEVQRVPHGNVLVLAAWNYPLLLPGVQIAQALAAGNTVILKPAPGCEEASRILVECFHEAGVPKQQLQLAQSTVNAATEAIQSGQIDLIVLTGGAATGRAVMQMAAETATPTIMELSGCDAMIVMEGADIELVARAVRFGLTFNGGATCIGPRRLIVTESMKASVVNAVKEALSDADPCTVHPSAFENARSVIKDALEGGATDVCGLFELEDFDATQQMAPLVLTGAANDAAIREADVFAPVMTVLTVPGTDSAVELVNGCRYRLSASVFGRQEAARSVAERLRVGSVIVNDLIAPTADPRLPFGGRGRSGFGVTRGAEGLLAMTVPRVISHRRMGPTPHLSPRKNSDVGVLSAAVQIMHGRGVRQKVTGLRRMITTIKNSADK